MRWISISSISDALANVQIRDLDLCVQTLTLSYLQTPQCLLIVKMLLQMISFCLSRFKQQKLSSDVILYENLKWINCSLDIKFMLILIIVDQHWKLFQQKKMKNENCTILIPKRNSYCRRKSSARGPRFKVSSEGLSAEIDISQRSPIQVQTKADGA